MTEPSDESVPDWTPAAVTLRAIYDEEGRLNSVITEFLSAPPAEDLARILAQFLMPHAAALLPQRVAGDALRTERDPILARRFAQVIRGGCMAVMNTMGGDGPHDNHTCIHGAGHDDQHRCECGLLFGG